VQYFTLILDEDSSRCGTENDNYVNDLLLPLKNRMGFSCQSGMFRQMSGKLSLYLLFILFILYNSRHAESPNTVSLQEV